MWHMGKIGLLLALGLLLGPWAQAATDRVALVIGNADYQSARLANPVRDAEAIKQVLERLGFEVIYRTNLDRDQLIRSVQDFRSTLRPDGIALMFYSGHGVEVDGVNYLLPVDNARIRTEQDAEVYGYSAQHLVKQMESAKGVLNVVILDACRDNPLPSRSKSASRGLGEMRARRGTLIAYATAAGQTADDGAQGQHSPYAEALLNWLGKPGLEVVQVFNNVAGEVSEQTKGAQEPWISSSHIPNIQLAGSAVVVERPGADGISAGQGPASSPVATAASSHPPAALERERREAERLQAEERERQEAAPAQEQISVEKPADANDVVAWRKFIVGVVKQNLTGMTAQSPFLYYIPGGDDEETIAHRKSQLDLVTRIVAQGMIAGHMMAFGGPDSALTAGVIKDAFGIASEGSFKGAIVLFIGDSEQQDEVREALVQSGATFRFVQM